MESHFDRRGTCGTASAKNEMRVELSMMDKAFKNKKGLYDAEHGKAVLSWAPASVSTNPADAAAAAAGSFVAAAAAADS